MASRRPHTLTTRVLTPVAAVIGAAALAMVPSAAHAAIGTPVPLGAGATFAVLAGAGVTNTGATTLAGDIGSFATTSITGPGTITLVGGVNRGGDAVTQQAKTDLVTAYNAASAQSPDRLTGVDLTGMTVEPGVYDTGDAIQLSGNLTLDANGDPDAVFIFQSLSTLITGAGSSITFIDGATACNLYWRVPTSATIGASSQFAGTILAEASITFNAAATLQGRALAQTGAVTMINNTIIVPACATVPGAPPTDGSPVPPTDGSPVPPTDGSPGLPTDGAGTPTVPGAPQVAVPPRGGVATGDGSSIASDGGGLSNGPVLAAVALTGLGLLAWVASSSRRTRLGE